MTIQPLAHRAPRRIFVRVGREALALVLLLVALANVITALVAQPWLPALLLGQVIELDDAGWGRVGVVTTGALLLLVARALARGKRHAWLLATGLLALSLIAEVIEHAALHSILVVSTLLAILLALAPLFTTRSDGRASIRGYVALALGGWLTWGHTLIFHLARAGALHIPHAVLPASLILTRVATYGILGYGVLQLLRPALATRGSAAEERERAAAVIRRHGHLSTVHFTLGADKSYFWSPSGRSLVAYRVTLGVALALADPIGPAEEREEMLRAFIAFCHKQDWQVALYQVTPEVKRTCRHWGMHAYKIGEDAILDVARFTLQGKPGERVRHAVARARRGSLTVRIFHGEALPEPIFAGMKRISAAWLHMQKATTQFGYSMGRFPLDWSPDLVTAVALGPDGAVQAYATWTPLFSGDGWALDNMRRDAETEPGAMEMLLAESIAWARERGHTCMTLGLVPLAGLGTPSCDSPSGVPDPRTASEAASILERSAAYLHQRGLLLGNYRTLHAFKAKFQVNWEPRYLIVDEVSALPRVFSALGMAMGIGWRGMLRDVWDEIRPARAGEKPQISPSDPTARDEISA